MSIMKVRYKDGSFGGATLDAYRHPEFELWIVRNDQYGVHSSIGNATFDEEFEFVGVGGGSIPIGPAPEGGNASAAKVPELVGRKYNVTKGPPTQAPLPWTLMSTEPSEHAWKDAEGSLWGRWRAWDEEVREYGLTLLPEDPAVTEKPERERLLWEIQTAVQDNYEHKLTMEHIRRIAAVVKGEDLPRLTHMPAVAKLKRLPNGCWINPKTVVRVLTPEDAAVIVFDSGEFIECVGLHPDAVVAALNAE